MPKTTTNPLTLDDALVSLYFTLGISPPGNRFRSINL